MISSLPRRIKQCTESCNDTSSSKQNLAGKNIFFSSEIYFSLKNINTFNAHCSWYRVWGLMGGGEGVEGWGWGLWGEAKSWGLRFESWWVSVEGWGVLVFYHSKESRYVPTALLQELFPKTNLYLQASPCVYWDKVTKKCKCKIYKQIYRIFCLTNRQTEKKTDIQKGRQAGRQAGRKAGRQAYRQAGRLAGRQAGRQAENSVYCRGYLVKICIL